MAAPQIPDPPGLLAQLKEAVDTPGTDPQVALQSVDLLATFILSPTPSFLKQSIAVLSSIYPIVFRTLAADPSNKRAWDVLTACKLRVVSFLGEDGASVPAGTKVASIKFAQRVALCQTGAEGDPRTQNKEQKDPNLSIVPPGHPFILPLPLEAEAAQLLQSLLALVFTAQPSQLITASLNALSVLAKQRPAFAQTIIPALASWSPAALQSTGADYGEVRSVEKLIKVMFTHLLRNGYGTSFAPQVSEWLAAQAARMEVAAREERARRIARAQPAAAAAEPSSSKRPAPAPAPEDAGGAKRARLEPSTSAAPSAVFAAANGGAAAPLAGFDVTSLPAALVVELIVESLRDVSEERLRAAIESSRRNIETATPAATSSALAQPAPSAPPAKIEEPEEEARPVDPLKVDIDEDELEFDPASLNQSLNDTAPSPAPAAPTSTSAPTGAAQLAETLRRLRQPQPLVPQERDELMRTAIQRIWRTAPAAPPAPTAGEDALPPGREVWMLLLARLITRGLSAAGQGKGKGKEPGGGMEVDGAEGEGGGEEEAGGVEGLREMMLEFVLADFANRVQFATLWLNEEWYNDRVSKPPKPPSEEPESDSAAPDRDDRPRAYLSLLRRLLDQQIPRVDASKDRDRAHAFARFVLDLPEIDPSSVRRFGEMCLDAESGRAPAGFSTLRDIVNLRPPARDEALGTLLELTTHQDTRIRRAAVNTVRRWVPDVQPMADTTRAFALQSLRALEGDEGEARLPPRPPPPSPPATKPEGEGEAGEPMEEGEAPAEVNPKALEEEHRAAIEARVLEYVELVFSLCVKVPDLLDDVFSSYTRMCPPVQEALQSAISPLIKGLGPTNGKLLTVLRTFPPEAEPLALRILNVLTDFGRERPSAPVVALVKSLGAERELDPRFLIPVLGEMDKSEIQKQLPRIVRMLNGTPENKALVRTVFSTVVTPPPSFGVVNTNQPRPRELKDETISPSELLVLLHEHETDIGLKSTIEAIGICFSMTDVFRSDVLAVFMQSVSEAATLPRLFLRTVIQAVSTYKTLVPFVSTNLFSRLITKKIWTNAELWTGFVRCAKLIAPHSFGALLQLPREQLRDVIVKQPGLKTGLQEYIVKKAPKAVHALKIFEEDADGVGGADATPATPGQEVSTPTPASRGGTPAPPPTMDGADPLQPTPVQS